MAVCERKEETVHYSCKAGVLRLNWHKDLNNSLSICFNSAYKLCGTFVAPGDLIEYDSGILLIYTGDNLMQTSKYRANVKRRIF